MIASCGGHIMELIQLLPAVEGLDYYIITEKNAVSESLVGKRKHYYLLQQQRNGWRFAFVFAWNILLSLVYFIKERPTTIITTGAGATYPTCKLASIFARKVIYIESFAKISNSSVTGKMVYPFADEFYVQWPEMKKIYPKAKYVGTVY